MKKIIPITKLIILPEYNLLDYYFFFIQNVYDLKCYTKKSKFYCVYIYYVNNIEM